MRDGVLAIVRGESAAEDDLTATPFGLPAVVVETIVCPADHGPLTADEPARRLVCATCGRRYPVTEDGIPVLLLDEAEAGERA